MNRISIYLFLTVVYLVLSMSFSTSGQKIPYLKNHHGFAQFFKGSPISVMLINYSQNGFLIKTYYHKYRLIHGFKTPEDIKIRVSKKFWLNNQINVGMSVFRRAEKDNTESTVPMPPGVSYIGDPFYGSWQHDHSGDKIWVFHRGYKHFPDVFGWSDFRPTYQFFQRATHAILNGQAFYGPNNEFGTDGHVTNKFLLNKQVHVRKIQKMKDHLAKYLELPWSLSKTKKQYNFAPKGFFK